MSENGHLAAISVKVSPRRRLSYRSSGAISLPTATRTYELSCLKGAVSLRIEGYELKLWYPQTPAMSHNSGTNNLGLGRVAGPSTTKKWSLPLRHLRYNPALMTAMTMLQSAGTL